MDYNVVLVSMPSTAQEFEKVINQCVPRNCRLITMTAVGAQLVIVYAKSE